MEKKPYIHWSKYYNPIVMEGGYLKDIPKPHVRMFPNLQVQRRVFITIESYVGVEYCYLGIHEEVNPLWNVLKGCWQIACDDVDANGLTEVILREEYNEGDMTFATYDLAMQRAQELVSKHFGYHSVNWFVPYEFCKDKGPLEWVHNLVT